MTFDENAWEFIVAKIRVGTFRILFANRNLLDEFSFASHQSTSAVTHGGRENKIEIYRLYQITFVVKSGV